MGGCLCLLFSKGHWLQKPKFQLKMWWCLHLGGGHLLQLSGGVSAFWSASNIDFKSLSVNFLDGVGVSTFWSASDTDFKNLSPKFRCDGVPALAENTFCNFQEVSPPWQRVPSGAFVDVSAFWSANDTDFKNVSSNFMDGGCLCLLISKWHWLQKCKFQLYGWGLSPPFDQQVTLTSKT